MGFDTGLVIRLQILSFAIVAAAVIASLLAHIAHFMLGASSVPLFRFSYFMVNVNNETNVPTWISSLLLALCGLFLLLIGASTNRAEQLWRRHWQLLGATFLFLSLDEFAQIHERLSPMLRGALELPVWMPNAWVLVVLPIAALWAAFFIPFLRNLPSGTRTMFLLSGGIYVTGAAGVEMYSGLMKSQYGMEDIRFALATWSEETLEMIGIAMFLKGVTDHLIRVYGLQSDK